MPQLTSPRLAYRAVSPTDVDTFHALATDEHIRRYLLDGLVVPRAWAADEIAASERLFSERQLGLWLTFDDGRVVGFCGFRVFAELDAHPQILYALLPRAVGRGLATEMTRALLAYAETIGFAPVRAGVDEINTASLRVLEKAGFRRTHTLPGPFGATAMYER